MHVFVRSLLPVAFLIVAMPGWASGPTGVFLPSAPTGPGGEDTIETASGTRCRQSMNSNGAYVDLGATGTAASPVDAKSRGYINEQRGSEATAYARITIPLGRRPARIDCSAVFQLEIQRLRREIELLNLAAE